MKRKAVFDDILYAQCWEDPELDRKAFAIGHGDTIFSITSGGCNVLTFLLDDPKRIIALDINPHQNYLLGLKIAAFKALAHGELLDFLGVRDSPYRLELYRFLRSHLTNEARVYWDGQLSKIVQGIIHCGQYERYMALLRTWIHRCIGVSTVQRLFEIEDPVGRVRAYRTEWDNLWWRLFTRVFLSRAMMTILFDKAFFEHVDRSFSFGRHFAERFEHTLGATPPRENYFLSYILRGNYYSEDHLPPYLQRQHHPIIRDRVDRVELVTDSCKHFFSRLPDSCISQFNFTNIFEWMSPDAYVQLLRDTIRVACDGATVTYRNLLVFRERPAVLSSVIQSLRDKARALHDRDRSFIYSNYVVEHINKGSEQCSFASAQYATAAR